MNNFEYLIIFWISQLQQFIKWLIVQIRRCGNFLNKIFLEFKFSFLFGKWSKFQKLKNFGTFCPFGIPAPFAIMPILILPVDINFLFYCSDSHKFSCSKFARSLIFKLEISAILKFYCSKFWPSPSVTYVRSYIYLRTNGWQKPLQERIRISGGGGGKGGGRVLNGHEIKLGPRTINSLTSSAVTPANIVYYI